MAVLEVEGLCAGYGRALSVRGADFSLDAGRILSIVGPNGAGKTTTLLALAGLVRPAGGTVRLRGEEITGLATHRIARRGLCLVPDDRGLFPDLTVAEHLKMATRSSVRSGKDGQTREPRTVDDVLEGFPALRALGSRRCGLLSGGEQQMLAIAKVLLLGPDVLMVDELSMGLAPVIVQELLPGLQRLARESSMGVILVEQHYEMALAISDDAIVLNHGEIVLRGRAADLMADRSALEQAYLGVIEAGEPVPG